MMSLLKLNLLQVFLLVFETNFIGVNSFSLIPVDLFKQFYSLLNHQTVPNPNFDIEKPIPSLFYRKRDSSDSQNVIGRNIFDWCYAKALETGPDPSYFNQNFEKCFQTKISKGINQDDHIFLKERLQTRGQTQKSLKPHHKIKDGGSLDFVISNVPNLPSMKNMHEYHGLLDPFQASFLTKSAVVPVNQHRRKRSGNWLDMYDVKDSGSGGDGFTPDKSYQLAALNFFKNLRNGNFQKKSTYNKWLNEYQKQLNGYHENDANDLARLLFQTGNSFRNLDKSFAKKATEPMSLSKYLYGTDALDSLVD